MNYLKGIFINDIDIQDNQMEVPRSKIATEITGTGMFKLLTRNAGNFAKHALYLPRRYDWIIVEDVLGELCLVPLHKKDNTGKPPPETGQ